MQRGAGNLWGGTPAIGGSINLITSNFTRQRGISVLTGGGTYNTRKYVHVGQFRTARQSYAMYARLGRSAATVIATTAGWNSTAIFSAPHDSART